jgi:hypothetical protein
VGYPLIDEFCRIGSLDSCQPSFFRRCQREFSQIVQPMLDERERLITENADLSEQVLALSNKMKVSVKVPMVAA